MQEDLSTRFILLAIFMASGFLLDVSEFFFYSAPQNKIVVIIFDFFTRLISVFPIFLLLFSILFKHPLDIITGQWIFRRYGINNRSSIWRTMWIALITVGCILIYAESDILNIGGRGSTMGLQTKLVAMCKPADEKEILIFLIDNCAAQFPSFFGFLIGGFFIVLGAFQAEFVSKYRLLHEIRRDALSKLQNDDRFRNGFTSKYNNPHYIYYIEHCFRFTMHKNPSFEQELKECVEMLLLTNRHEEVNFKEKYGDLYDAIMEMKNTNN